MFKWLGRLFLIGILAVIGICVFAYFSLKAMEPPSIEDAPYALQAYYESEGLKIPTRFYYAENIEIEQGIAVLDNYWTFDGEKYHKHNDIKKVEPPYSIARRLR